MVRFKTIEEVKAKQARAAGKPIRIVGIDPGPANSAWAIYDPIEQRVVTADIVPSDDIFAWMELWKGGGDPLPLVIEKVESYGMPVGSEIFETVFYAGRFFQAYHEFAPVDLIGRKAVKIHLCGTAQCGDPEVRAALIQRLGEPGTKKDPGPTYGVHRDMWAALAVAVVGAERGLYGLRE